MSNDEKRRAARHEAEVKVDYRTIGSFITDYSKDISQGGIFIATSVPLNVGELVRLRITLPGKDLPFPLEGVVRWASATIEGLPGPHQGPGMGVEFINFSEEIREELRRFVADVDATERG